MDNLPGRLLPVLPDHGGLERAEGDSPGAGCVGRGAPGTDPSCDLFLGPALHSTVKTPPAPLRQTRLGAGKSVGTWSRKARGHCKSHRHVLQMRPQNLLSWPETQVSGGLCPLALPLAPCAVAHTPSRPPVSWPMPLVPSMPQPVAPSRPATGLRALLPGPLDTNSQLEGHACGPFPHPAWGLDTASRGSTLNVQGQSGDTRCWLLGSVFSPVGGVGPLNTTLMGLGSVAPSRSHALQFCESPSTS